MNHRVRIIYDGHEFTIPDVGAEEMRRRVADGELLVAAAGLRRPRVLVSAGALLALDDDELEASLEHERGHIARRHRYVLVVSELSAYIAAKGAIVALTKTLGRELAPENITVNAVAPGVIDTPQLHVDADSAGVTLAAMHDRYGRDIPIGRIGKPAEIAATVAMLTRADLGALVGQTIQINGGSTRCRV